MRATLLLCGVLVAACGPKPTLHKDAGPVEDAGVDAGVDAGRARGDDPPNGWSTALPLDSDAGTSTRVGVGASMVLDQFGQPMVAAIIVDPNGDGVFTDNRLVFTRWDGVAKTYQPAVTVEVIGAIDVSHPNRPVSLARNPTTGQIGVAYLNEGGAVRYGVSDDEGAHFSLEVASEAIGGATLANPVLAMTGAANTIHVVYGAKPRVIHRSRTGAGSWATAEVQGSLTAREWPIAMALDSAGSPGIAFFSDDLGGTTTLSYVAQGSTQAIATTTAMLDTQNKAPSVSLTLQGDVPRVAFHLLSATEADAELWYAAKSSGAWSQPVVLPRNGPMGMLDSTRWYQAIVVDGSPRISIAGHYARANAPSAQLMCGGPKLGRSTDGSGWAVCHPPETSGATAHAISQGGLWVSIASHKPNKVTIALDYEERFNPTINGLGGPGVLIYREP